MLQKMNFVQGCVCVALEATAGFRFCFSGGAWHLTRQNGCSGMGTEHAVLGYSVAPVSSLLPLSLLCLLKSTVVDVDIFVFSS